MAHRQKRVVSFDPELDARIAAAAVAVDLTVSAWLARCAEDRLITEGGLRAMIEYEELFGALPSSALQAFGVEIDAAVQAAQSAYRR